MSKLLDNVKAKAGDRVMPPIQPMKFVDFTSKEDFGQTMDIYRYYKIGVELFVRTRLPENERQIPAAIEQARKLICEEVFGEFREPIMRARAALLEYDHGKADKILQDLLDKMFSV